MAQRVQPRKWTTSIFPAMLKKIKAEAKREGVPQWHVVNVALKEYFVNHK